ncbi:MAG: SpaA isopeptide-forming pilin-related protein, partial [Angelakisella sp.]
GTALLESLEIGTTYIVEESEPPAGYLSSGYRQEIVLKESRTHTLTVANSKMPALEIIKKDKAIGAFLEGATFRVSWNSGADYQDVTTGKDGKATLTDLKDGWYSVVETNAPEGYLLDTTPHQVLLEAGKTGVIELFNEAKPSLTILKLDSVTKTPLQYAKFRIEQKTDGDNKLIGEYVSDADGMVKLENIIPGRYIVTEIAAPDGYSIDTATHEVTIEFGQAYKIELTNTPKSPIYIQKVDEKGEPLAGAKFKVTTMNGAMVGTVTSGRTGFAIIPYAEPGWYIVEEVQAPDGYVLSSAPINIEVKSGKPAQVEFVNYQKPMLQIVKLDADTQKALL